MSSYAQLIALFVKGGFLGLPPKKKTNGRQLRNKNQHGRLSFPVESMYQSFNDESLPAQIRGKETLGNPTPNFRCFEVSHYTLLLRWSIL